MSTDEQPSVTEEKLVYDRKGSSFARVPKNKPKHEISLARNKGESDYSYALRLDQEANRQDDLAFRTIKFGGKILSDQDSAFVHDTFRAKSRYDLIQAQKKFDGALFDKDLNAAFDSYWIVHDYLKGKRFKDMDAEVFRFLSRIASSKDPGYTPVAEEQATHYRRFQASQYSYEALTTGALMLMLIIMPRGMEKVSAIHRIFEKRKKDGLELLSVANDSSYRFMVDAFHRYHFTNLFPQLNPLDWARDGVEVIDYLAERNSPLLGNALASAVKMIQDWAEDNGSKRSLVGKYGTAARSDIPLTLLHAIKRHATSEQVCGETFEYYFTKIEDIKKRLLNDLDDQRYVLELQRQDLLNLWGGPA